MMAPIRGCCWKRWPDLERRDYIVMAGPDEFGNDWVGCGGYYTGTFTGPWLDIPPTGHQVSMRYHEFFRFVDGKVVEISGALGHPRGDDAGQCLAHGTVAGARMARPGPRDRRWSGAGTL